MPEVLTIVVNAALTWIMVLIAAVVIALARGTDPSRRLVLVDTSVLLLLAALMLMTIRSGDSYFLHAALALALLSFVGSIVVAAHASRHAR